MEMGFRLFLFFAFGCLFSRWLFCRDVNKKSETKMNEKRRRMPTNIKIQ